MSAAAAAHGPHPLVGRTLQATRHGRPIPLRIERVLLGYAECRSLDLQWTARVPLDAIQRALHATTAESMA